MVLQIVESNWGKPAPASEVRNGDVWRKEPQEIGRLLEALEQASEWATLIVATSGRVEDELEQQFNMLASRWRNQTGGLSSPTKQVAHSDYLKIIAMGKPALPFVLRELRDRGGQWYPALRAISDADPVPEDAVGYVPRMKLAWLEWGHSHGLI